VDVIEPYLGRRILEVGSGIGNISRFLPKRELLTVSDVDPVYMELLENAYRDHDLVSVARFDLGSDEDARALARVGFDTVVCLNVLEHIEDDAAALRRLRQILPTDGRLVLLVPQYPSLYGTYDQRLGHCRRYDRADLETRLTRAGFRVRARRNFNALGIAGWRCVRPTIGNELFPAANFKSASARASRSPVSRCVGASRTSTSTPSA